MLSLSTLSDFTHLTEGTANVPADRMTESLHFLVKYAMVSIIKCMLVFSVKPYIHMF